MTNPTHVQPFSEEFREKALRLLDESLDSYPSESKAIEAIARQLNISSQSLRRWKRQTQTQQAENHGADALSVIEENKRLRRENHELKMANEILVSASAFFASRLAPKQR